jgi:hypothetical protein
MQNDDVASGAFLENGLIGNVCYLFSISAPNLDLYEKPSRFGVVPHNFLLAARATFFLSQSQIFDRGFLPSLSLFLFLSSEKGKIKEGTHNVSSSLS